jgi:hypothetical protein
VGLEQLQHRDFFAEVEVPDREGEHVRVMGSGVRVDGRSLKPPFRPPLLGEHNDERLAPAAGRLS